MRNPHIDELIKLLKPIWLKNKELTFLQLLALINKESGSTQPLNSLSDAAIITHLQALQTKSNETVHLIDEVLELLAPYWIKNNELSLMALLALLQKQSGFSDALDKLTDSVIIYHLKMDQTEEGDMIPGIKKDCEDDFQTALLKARGLI